MSFLKDLKSVVREESAVPRAEISKENPLFVYVRMPVDLDPEDRHELFAEPLQEALEKEDMGAVTGGGTMFSPPDDDGEDEVQFSGVDVDIYDLARGMDLLRHELIRLQAPQGTTLLYKLEGREWEEPIYPNTIC
ncbi:MAG TPA: hypothetical protein VJV96_12770 [Candidatus Angelobacter sp.]|nr:hypothetical protein [Candidatus Angelobacter sp.]